MNSTPFFQSCQILTNKEFVKAEIYKLLSQSNSEPKSQNEERSTQFEEILNIISSDSSTGPTFSSLEEKT
jgi:hypothetical protein